MIRTLTEVFSWLIAGAWGFKLAECFIGLRRVPDLRGEEHGQASRSGESVVAIVPARNEEANVGACIESLVRQDYVDLRVLAVDDRSEDRTGTVLREAATRFPHRLEVMQVTQLPAGWLGKTHAMAMAANTAIARDCPEWLLFTDADIMFEEDTIRKSLAEARSSNADHFVLMPTTVAGSAGEGAVLSFMQVMSLWALRPWQVANPKAKRDAIGVGAFNLIRTTAYLQLGGFDAIPMEILEDLTLGRRVKQSGLRQRVATGPGMVSVHWAPGVSGIVRGITKNVFAVFQFRPLLLMLAALWLAVFCIAPFVFLWVAGLRLAGSLAMLSAVGLYILSSRKSRLSGWFSLFLPVSASIVIYALLRSMIVTLVRGGVIWRGTFYNLKELRRHSREE